MKNINRRNFLRNCLLATGAITLGNTQTFSQGNELLKPDVRPFEILALGDSVMWGQGLFDKNKFTFIIRRWLETDIFKCQRHVNLFVAAHSGASIENKSDKRKKLVPTKTYNGEINLFNPSIKQQAVNSYKWYRDQNFKPDGFNDKFEGEYGRRFPEHLEFYKGKPVMPENVDLILVNGGINDLNVRNFVNPAFSKGKFKELAEKYCNERMRELLEKLILMFPNARIVVTGYFPLISKETCPDKAIEAMTNAFGRNIIAKLFQNIARKVSLTDKQVRDKLAERSTAWVCSANEALDEAVKATNEFFPMKDNFGKAENRVFFAKVYPEFIKDENAYGTDLRENGKKCAFGNEKKIERSFVWEFKERARTNDELYYERDTKICTEKEIIELKRPDRFICRRAGLFHPNIKGAEAYSKAIKEEINKNIDAKGWKTSL